MNSPALPLLQSYHPMTFSSRGVTAPFTTPLLAGARVRGSRKERVEVVVPSPSGSRGLYVLHWPGVRALCSPTVHDTLLFSRCGRLTAITPPLVREAALEIAAEGHAGRDAAAAAAAAIAHDRGQAVLAHFMLLKGLVEHLTGQIEPNGRTMAASPERLADLDRGASAVLHRIAPSLGRSPAYLAAAVTALGDLCAPVGVAPADRDARIPRLLDRLEETRADLAEWLRGDPANDIDGLGQAVAAALQWAYQSGTAALDRARALIADPPALLGRWIRDPESIRAHALRCDWLLDGWERVSLLWLAARTTPARRAALLEMAPLVPVLPREVTDWADIVIPARAMRQTCRITSNDDGWRTGAPSFGLIARNESLIAVSARAGLPRPRAAAP